MAILLALLAALGYGTSDFYGGLLSRRLTPGTVAGIVVSVEVVTTLVGLVLFPGQGPSARALAWGMVSGVGSGIGSFSLYRGLAAGQMAVTATLSAVLAAVLPACLGLALGEHLGVLAAVGIMIAVPAIALVSWPPAAEDAGSEPGAGSGFESPPAHGARGFAPAGVLYGVLAGLGFALLFIGLDRAGTRAGAWPALSCQLVALLIIAPPALHGMRGSGRPGPRDLTVAIGAGVLAGIAALCFLAATGHGELSIVAVVTSLYPACTVLLARVRLAEHWSTLQAVGLCVAAASIVLVSLS